MAGTPHVCSRRGAGAAPKAGLPCSAVLLPPVYGLPPQPGTPSCPPAFYADACLLLPPIPQVGTISEAYPHLIFDRFSSKLGTRVASILKHLFPPPKPDSKRVITFANQVGRQLAPPSRPSSSRFPPVTWCA